MKQLTIQEIRQKVEEYSHQLPELRLPTGHPDGRSMAKWIDHTLLKPEALPAQVEQLCAEARQYQFASVCVNPLFGRLAASQLEGSGVPVCVVVGFPLGANPSRVKVVETRTSIEDGATEIDMVVPIGLLRAGSLEAVMDDIQAVCETAHAQNAIVKVILENTFLDQAAKIAGCLLSQAAGVDFVKTSTGFGPSGATLADVELMRRVVGPDMGVKAAGGIRSLADAEAFLAAGATRLGSSSGVKIMQEIEARGS
jgi:deoxyribose-phosphate aldolase